MPTATPFWELTFDGQGDVDGAQLDALLAGAARERLTDLVVVAHGWNNLRSGALDLYDRFLAPFPGLLAAAGSTAVAGYVGVIWPSMRWSDEAIPDLETDAPRGDDGTASLTAARTGAAAPPLGLDDSTKTSLIREFAGQEAVIARLAELLDTRPDDREALDEFFQLVQRLVASSSGGDEGEGGEDAVSVPRMLTDDPETVSRRFVAELEALGALRREDDGTAGLGDRLGRLWHGAREALRQATYWEMKNRAGTVGRLGLGAVVGRLGRDLPVLRVHLVGHSFGARLVSFVLTALPAKGSAVRSVVLLQGAFSHFAFADALPHDRTRGGALRGLQRRVNGPLVACFSSFDTAVGRLYPLASFSSNEDSAAVADRWYRWGGIGFDGAQEVQAAPARIGGADRGTRYPFSPGRFTNVDASAVVRRGDTRSGAHSDICHPELAWLVLAAGGMV